jgi:hypothetical protein
MYLRKGQSKGLGIGWILESPSQGCLENRGNSLVIVPLLVMSGMLCTGGQTGNRCHIRVSTKGPARTSVFQRPGKERARWVEHWAPLSSAR